MNRRKTILLSIFLLIGGFISCNYKNTAISADASDEAEIKANQSVQLIDRPAAKRVDVLFDGALFTSYRYPEEIPKPVLWPIISNSGKILTRSYPLEKKAGERIDHPHHVGLWFNYGDVNGLDFWNNSGKKPTDKKRRYGIIRHQEILSLKDGDSGTLKVKAAWMDTDSITLLEEITTFVFSHTGNQRFIDRITTLKAVKDVGFKDNKEGMLALRVARALELPADNPALFSMADGSIAREKTVDNEGVTGNYLSSTGLEGNDVWGTRARWVKLYGLMEGEEISIAILDHPHNVGFPAYWHARGYGLFSVNPLGQEIFSKGKEVLNYKLNKGDSVTFRYRIIIQSGNSLEKKALDGYFEDFAQVF